MFRTTVFAGALVIGLALLIADRGSSQQDKTDPAPTVKGQLPKYWSKIGLSDEQKQKVYATEASYRTKIEALNQQVKRLKSQQKTALEKILTDDQKAALRRLLLEKAPQASGSEGEAKKTGGK
jgi:hypothetical protein